MVPPLANWQIGRDGRQDYGGGRPLRGSYVHTFCQSSSTLSRCWGIRTPTLRDPEAGETHAQIFPQPLAITTKQPTFPPLSDPAPNQRLIRHPLLVPPQVR